MTKQDYKIFNNLPLSAYRKLELLKMSRLSDLSTLPEPVWYRNKTLAQHNRYWSSPRLIKEDESEDDYKIRLQDYKESRDDWQRGYDAKVLALETVEFMTGGIM